MSRFREIVFCQYHCFFRRHVFLLFKTTHHHAIYRWPPPKLCSATLTNAVMSWSYLLLKKNLEPSANLVHHFELIKCIQFRDRKIDLCIKWCSESKKKNILKVSKFYANMISLLFLKIIQTPYNVSFFDFEGEIDGNWNLQKHSTIWRPNDVELCQSFNQVIPKCWKWWLHYSV